MVENQNINFSIIIPTYKEAKNIENLVQRIENINFGPRLFELLIVDDDSNDGTKEIIDHLKIIKPWLRLIIRNKNRGLSQSVIEGIENAAFPLCVIMDADLSHPPEKIPELLLGIQNPEIDIVIGSRYIKGGSFDDNWPFTRKIISHLAAFVPRLLISTKVKDPLSGFIALKKSTFVLGIPLNPIGWKIGLEMMIKYQCKNIMEVPIHFSQRIHGKSKLNLKVLYNYFRHIQHLIIFKLVSFVR